MTSRLAHGWTLACEPPVPQSLAREYIRPAVRAVPSSMARRIGPCRIALAAGEGSDIASRWTARAGALEVWVATADVEPHDAAMELLTCLGQALWEKLTEEELRLYWALLNEEIGLGIDAEIDEESLERKRSLLKSLTCARSMRRLMEYGRASFAATAAEYVHCLWHDVTVRSGPGCLPVPQLRRRLELLARWFPPDRGYRLFAPARRYRMKRTSAAARNSSR